MQHCPHLWPARLKAQPEDFQVIEEITLQPSGRGPYRLYRLTKRGWGTEELVSHLARRLGLPRSAFAYGGRKDRNAVTVQHLTIRGRRDRSCDGEGFALRSVGFADRPMAPNAIAANHFTVVLRALPAAARRPLEDGVARIASIGVPNYFDDQRFRSLAQYGACVGELLVRRRWEEALRLLLTSPGAAAGRGERERLARLQRCWGRWEECLPLARSPLERRVLQHLSGPGGDPIEALHFFPPPALALLLAAYQSRLWNRALATAVRRRAAAWVGLPGLAGEYLFPLAGGAPPSPLAGLGIPTPARRLAEGDTEGTSLIEEVLAEEGLTQAALALRPLRAAYLTSTLRPAAVTPAQLSLAWLPPEPDGGLAVRLHFSLPAGSYATVVVRAVLLRPSWEPTPTGAHQR